MLSKLLAVIIAPSLLYGICYLVLKYFGITQIPTLIESVVLELLTLVVIIYLFHFYKKGAIAKLNTTVFSLKKAILLIPISLLVRVPAIIIFVIIEAFNLFPYLSQSFDEGVKFQWSDLATPTGFGTPVDITLALFLTVIVTPIVEELLFRGVIFNFLRTKWSVPYAFFGTCVIFTLVHVYVGLFIGTFIMGLALTWVYYKWGNIKYSMILHGLINLLPFLLGVLSK